MPDTTTPNGFALNSINFGNNLIEIGALTTLIGSTVAQTLVLGDRGSAGLVWGTISTFGASSVIKACISGASSGWVRALLGLRDKASDVAVGLELELARDSRGAIRVRNTLDVPLGISCDSKKTVGHVSKEHHSCKDIYAFDRSTARMLEGLPSTSPGDNLTVYKCGSYPFFRARDTRFQASALVLSLIKSAELYYEWLNGAPLLALVSAVPFSFFFVAASIIEAREFLLGRNPADVGHLDLLVGAFPTPKKTGGEKKIVLGVSANPKTSIWWRLMWSIGVSLYTASLITTYFLLNQQPAAFVLTWAGFQVAWLAFRILINYFADTQDPMADRMMVPHHWDDLEPSLKARVFNLALAEAKYQTHVHPRDAESYRDDSFSPLQITSLLGKLSKLHTSYKLPDNFNPTRSSTIEVNIVGIIGDTALSSASWMVGSNISAMDLYDSCLIVFSLPPTPPTPASPQANPGPQTIAIPAARVLSSRPFEDVRNSDKENWAPIFVPRGAGSRHPGVTRTWWYWIPCEDGRWLQVRSEQLTVLGKRTAEVLGGGQLTTFLAAGNLNISLGHAKDVEAITKISRRAAESLLQLLR